MALYAADGSIRVTEVSGSAITGAYASDGSWNVVESLGTVFVGTRHPCGALWVTLITSSSQRGVYAPDGSLYVQVTPYSYPSAGIKVTDVLGTLSSSFTAPLLAFVSATDPDSDNTQDFTADFYESIVGKVVRLVGTFGSATVSTFDVDSSNTIDAGEDAALQAAFTTGVIPNGLCAFKCRIEDGSGNALSDWSNTVSKTIIPSYRGTYYYLGF